MQLGIRSTEEVHSHRGCARASWWTLETHRDPRDRPGINRGHSDNRVFPQERLHLQVSNHERQESCDALDLLKHRKVATPEDDCTPKVAVTPLEPKISLSFPR